MSATAMTTPTTIPTMAPVEIVAAALSLLLLLLLLLFGPIVGKAMDKGGAGVGASACQDSPGERE